MLFASWTGTAHNLRVLQDHGWSLLMSPDTLRRCKGKTAPRWPDGSPAPYALDNGAWGCHQQGRDFDGDAFGHTVDSIGAGASWVVVPDIVGGGLQSLSLSRRWLPRIDHPLKLIAVQDGMSIADVDPLMGPGRGLFLGGSTEWKIRTMAMWGRYARRIGAYYHVGRVNTVRRIRMAMCAGAHSVDGTSATRWSANVPRLTSTTVQTCIFDRGSSWS